jgi:ATP-dependent Clp protease adapter protein ClpS
MRKNRILLLGILVLALAGIYALFPRSEGRPTTLRQPQSEAVRPATAEGIPRPVQPESNASTASAETLPQDEDVINTSDFETIMATVASTQAAIEAIEKKNSSEIFHQVYANGKAEVVFLSITPPNDQERELLMEIKQDGLSKLSSHERAASKLKEMFNEVVYRRLNYPNAYKVVGLTVPANEARAPVLVEYFADDPTSALPNDKGQWSVPGDFSQNLDEEYGSFDSWGKKRYGHLFSIDR